jgi:CheY-like chemotaxis protein
LLICDYHLGGKETGIEVIRQVRESVRHALPVILVSGDTSAAIVKQSSVVDDCHLLSKPVDADDLLDLSARLLAPRGVA